MQGFSLQPPPQPFIKQRTLTTSISPAHAIQHPDPPAQCCTTVHDLLSNSSLLPSPLHTHTHTHTTLYQTPFLHNLQPHFAMLHNRPYGGFSCQVKSAVVNFAAGNFAEVPVFCVVNFADNARSVVVCRALQAPWSLATGAYFAEAPGFGAGNFAANLKRGISPTKMTAPKPPTRPVTPGSGNGKRYGKGRFLW